MSKTDIPYLDEVLNVTSGCTKISEGCANCYAERINLRFGHTPAYDVNCPIKTHPERLEEALRWRRPRRAGVCFTSDLFHDQVPDDFIDKVFAVMALTPQHTYLLLTKRPERMREYLSDPSRKTAISGEMDRVLTKWAGWGAGLIPPLTWPLPNVFLGVSAENQRWADERIPLLLETPGNHWLSLEPLLGPIRFPLPCKESTFWGGISWVVVGGESEPKARPCDLGWIRDIRDQCKAAGVPVYIKQLGAKPIGEWSDPWGNPSFVGHWRLCDRKGENPDEWPPDLRVRETPEVTR